MTLISLPLPGRLAGARRRVPERPPATLASWTCPECCSDAVALAESHSRGPAHRWMRMRCGECAAWRETVMPDAVAARFLRHLAAGLAVIEAQADRLRRDRIDPSASSRGCGSPGR